MEISEWLRSLYLVQYEPAFRENAIDLKILPELSETDLEKLGVVLGHRKRMLRAIAALAGAPTTPPAAALRTEEAERYLRLAHRVWTRAVSQDFETQKEQMAKLATRITVIATAAAGRE